mmetsp:Transcript_5378/g.16049  ORF Transcript_5378/g.16049 Transcript_5378/m.16049 type:complete len:228 (-) Transcript_5378:1584-2267(-)
MQQRNCFKKKKKIRPGRRGPKRQEVNLCRYSGKEVVTQDQAGEGGTSQSRLCSTSRGLAFRRFGTARVRISSASGATSLLDQARKRCCSDCIISPRHADVIRYAHFLLEAPDCCLGVAAVASYSEAHLRGLHFLQLDEQGLQVHDPHASVADVERRLWCDLSGKSLLFLPWLLPQDGRRSLPRVSLPLCKPLAKLTNWGLLEQLGDSLHNFGRELMRDFAVLKDLCK